MKPSILTLATAIFATAALFTACKNDNSISLDTTQQIHYHFASKTEGQKLMAGHTEYYASLSQNDIDWRMKKSGATLDELKAFGQQEVRDFSKEETIAMKKAMDYVEERLRLTGCRLPFPNDIAIVKTTMNEESGAGAYTQKTEIYVGQTIVDYATGVGIEEEYKQAYFEYVSEIMAHELFHCLTRNNPDFRRKMYHLIGFNIMEQDIELPASVKETLLSNPDVEHIDNYAEFLIDGRMRQCELIVRYTKTWDEAYAIDGENASFFNYNESVLIPLDDLETAFPIDGLDVFWDKIGHNSEYVFAPEEYLADNFAFAVVYGLGGLNYPSPQLISNILNLLKKEYGTDL